MVNHMIKERAFERQDLREKTSVVKLKPPMR